MKTIEEILEEYRNDSSVYFHEDDCLAAMQAYAEQQVSIAVERALEVVAKEAKVKGLPMDEGGYLKIVDREHILSLAPQILEELKGGEGE